MAGDSTVVLITGANTGLGYEMVRALCGAERSYEILLGGRSLAKAEKAAEDARREFPSSKSRVTPLQMDVEDDASIEAASALVREQFGRLDALVNNSGALFDLQFLEGSLTMRQTWNKSWDVNTTGSQVVTHTLVPLLLESRDPRLLFISSGTATLAGTENSASPVNQPMPKGWPKNTNVGRGFVPAYRSVKTGLNMMMREWHRYLRADGVKVWAISPGYLATGLGGSVERNKHFGAADPALGGQLVKTVLEGGRDADVGKVVTRDGVQEW